MALKALMLRRSIDMKAAELEGLNAKDAEFEARGAELTAGVEEVKTPEEQTAMEAMVEAYDAELSAHEQAKATLTGEIAQLREELEQIEAHTPAVPVRTDTKNERMNTAMLYDIQCNVRALPKTQRAFEAAFSYEKRCQIVQSDEFKAFVNNIRAMAGRPNMNAAVSGADLLIPEVFLPLIRENMFRYSKLLNRVHVETVRGDAKQPVGGLTNPAVWTDDCGNLNEIDWSMYVWPMQSHKLGAFLAVCNSLLEDATMGGMLNLAGAIVEMISMAMGMAKDEAILYGKGNGNMPLGIVPSLAATSAPASYPTTARPWTDLHSTHIIKINGDSLTGAAFWAALEVAAGNTFSRYARGELFWAMNSKTRSYLKSKAIATTVTGEWVALIGGRLPIVSGDIDVLEFMPDYDIVGGYGELYTYAEREGITLGMDNVGFVNRVADQTVFFAKERGDGAPIIREAFIAMNIKNLDVTTSFSFPADAANDATIASLSIGETLSPSFDKDTLTYTATASNDTDVITAIMSQQTAQVEITLKKGSSDAKQILNGSTVTWAAGSNVLTFKTKHGSNTLTYTVTVTKN